MEIKRDKYLQDLINRMHNGMIKVVTGIRRSGKSYLIFHIFQNYLLEQGVPESHIIRIELDQRRHRQYRDPDVILEYIESCIQDQEMYYMKDIIERHHIEKTQELEDLVNILASAIGSLTNVPKIESTFKSVLRSKISGNTIRQYTEYLEDAFIIHKANRYNVKGRKYIGTPVKYYFEDVGLRNARLGFRQVEETHLMENIIYNELRSRGYAVDVGIVEKRKKDASGKAERKQLEIDFVANKGSQRYYIQSAFAMPDEQKQKQEKMSLLQVKDSFKKIIVVKDVVNVMRDDNGITTMSVYDFLLKDNSLEL